MGDAQILTVIRIWAAMAWADGVLADSEAVALRRLIDATELDDASRATARAWLTAPVELDETGLAALAPDARAGIYRAACRVAAVDRHVSDDERAMLGRLCAALGLDRDGAREIEASVLGGAGGR